MPKAVAHHRRLPANWALRVDRLLEATLAVRGAGRRHVAQRDDVLRPREELAEQMPALKDLAAMAKALRLRHHAPAANAPEAVPWTYFAYLGAIKEANGAAMSIGWSCNQSLPFGNLPPRKSSNAQERTRLIFFQKI